MHGAAIYLPTDRHTAFAMTTQNFPAVLARVPCHCEPQQDFLRSLNVSLPRATLVPRVAWWKQSACQLQVIYLLTDRHTAFAMTILNLSLLITCRALLVIANSERVKQSTRDDNLLTDGHVVLQDSSP